MTLTQDQIDSFNAYQAWGGFHPFTCSESHPEGRDLVAREDGLSCPQCSYRQDWCHDWMLDWSWKKSRVGMMAVVAELEQQRDCVLEALRLTAEDR